METKRILKTGILFVLVFCVFLLVHIIGDFTEEKYVFGDISEYYTIGKSLFKDGAFSLSGISNDFRGYVFPVFLGICHKLNLELGITNSLFYVSSFILSLLYIGFIGFMDKVMGNCFDERKMSLVTRIVPALFLVLFYYGLIVYPLTDLYAALLCIFGTMLIYKATMSRSYSNVLMYVFAGIILYMVYNVRTIYQLSFLLYPLYIFIFFKVKYIQRLIAILAYFSGGVMAAVPQLYLNYARYGIISPWINNESLFSRQLFWGLQYSRYATYLGDPEVHRAAMYFMDETGVKLLQKASELGIQETIVGYIQLFLKFPLEFISILGKHFINAIFIIYPEQYIFDLSKNRYPYIILSIVVVFVFVCVFKEIVDSRLVLFRDYTLLVFMLIPNIAILFGAVEERFLILPYMIIYYVISSYNYKKAFSNFTVNKVTTIVICFFLFITVTLAIEGEILSSLNGYPLIFSSD